MTISFLVWQEAFKINLAKLVNHPKKSGNLGEIPENEYTRPWQFWLIC